MMIINLDYGIRFLPGCSVLFYKDTLIFQFYLGRVNLFSAIKTKKTLIYADISRNESLRL